MSDVSTFTLSFKSPSGNTATVRADSEQDLFEALDSLARVFVPFAEVERTIFAMGNIYEGMMSPQSKAANPPAQQQQQRSAPAAQSAPAQSAPAQTGGAPLCPGHSRAMVHREGTTNGKAWAGYFCDNKVKANQCPVQWDR